METGRAEMSKNEDFPVDMVYLWCDGGDPEFLRRKAKFSEETEGVDMERMYLEHRFPEKSFLRNKEKV